jgi:DNA-binding PadR family transcriptional regulator
MSERQLLGEVEQLVLLTILRLGEGTYAVPIRDEIIKQTGVDLSRGTIYVTLDRLERKGYIRSWFADPTPEPGGKSRRCVGIERDGVMALRAAQRMVDRLAAGTALAPRKGK